MRKINRKKNISFKGLILLFCISTISMSVGYSLLSQNLSIEGTVNLISENTQSQSENLELTYDQYSWGGGNTIYYQFNFTLTNKGVDEVKDWQISIDVPENTSVSASWSMDSKIVGNKLIIVPNGYSAIKSGEYITFGIQLISSTPDFKIDNTSISEPEDILEQINSDDPNKSEISDTPNLDVRFNRENYWGYENNYTIQYTAYVQNKSTENIKNWHYSFKVPEGTTVNSYYNCNYIIKDDTIIIYPADWNNVISSSSELTMGFQLNVKTLDFDLKVG